LWSKPDLDVADEIVDLNYDPVWVHIAARGPDQVKHEMLKEPTRAWLWFHLLERWPQSPAGRRGKLIPFSRLEVEVMDKVRPSSVALQFVERINQGDLEGIASLTSEEYTFTDTAGRVYFFRGKDAIKRSWDEYLSAYPDYKIHVHQVLIGGNGVAIIGKTSGSHVPPEIEEEETVLWVAQVLDGLVSEWRIYSDEEYAQLS
jgi:hypothetical protein